MSAREFPVGLGDRDVRGPYANSQRQLGLNDAVRLLWRRRAVIAVTVTAITLVFALLAFTLPPRYTAAATILVLGLGPDPVLVTVDSVTRNRPTDRQEMATNIQLLTADRFVSGVVDALDLHKDPEFNHTLPGGPRVWDWIDDWAALFLSPPALSEREQRDKSVAVLKSQLQVEQTGEASMIAVRVASYDPQKAAQIANAFAVRFMSDRLDAKRQAISAAALWLNQRLAGMRSQVLESEGAVASFYGEQGLAAERVDNAVLRQLDQLTLQLALAETRRAQAEARLQQARELRRSSGLVQAAANLFMSTHLRELRAQEGLLERQLAEASTRYGPQHPTLLNIQAQLDVLRARTGEETSRIFADIENELNVARAEERQLRERVGQLQQLEREQQTAAVPGLELQRQADVERTLYTSHLLRYKQVSDQLDLATPGVEIISEASPPASPSFPNKMLMITGSFAGSILLGIFLAFMAEVLDSGLRSAQQVEEALGVPVLAMIPRIMRRERRFRWSLHHYLRAHPRSRFADAVRGLKLGIAQTNLELPPKVILMTSALPGEGKTSLALCLATAAAEEGLCTVIVDLDLHRPRLRQVLRGAYENPGIVELITNECSLEQALMTDQTTPGIYAITVNRSTANPAALYGTKRMADLIKKLRDRFDMVVLDTPPTLAVGDARILARLADALVYVVRWGSTHVDAGRAGIEKLFDLPTPIVGAVLNRVDVKRHAQRAYGDALQYYRKYEHYYRD